MLGLLQAALLPSGFASLLFLGGLATILFRRNGRAGCTLLGMAAAVLLIFSNGLTATLILSPLEYAYTALEDPRQHPDARFIVVLTAFAVENDNMPLSSRMNASSAFRVLEAANLWSRRPDCHIIVTGSTPAAEVMAEQLRSLGVPPGAVSVDVAVDNTAHSAERVRSIVGEAPIFLVTSAGHMSRAVGVFRKRGVLPIPAPTDYQLPSSARNASWTTSAVHLLASDLAVHEYLGIAWYRLTGRL